VFLSEAGVPEDKVVFAVIGESADQPILGQLAVACGIKNRPEGLQGVNGADLKRIPTEKEYANAGFAVYLSEFQGFDYCWYLIQGADMWCSDLDVCNKAWTGVPMVFVKKIYDHYFFRRLKGGE